MDACARIGVLAACLLATMPVLAQRPAPEAAPMSRPVTETADRADSKSISRRSFEEPVPKSSQSAVGARAPLTPTGGAAPTPPSGARQESRGPRAAVPGRRSPRQPRWYGVTRVHPGLWWGYRAYGYPQPEDQYPSHSNYPSQREWWYVVPPRRYHYRYSW
jgi:hypothetical protein